MRCDGGTEGRPAGPKGACKVSRDRRRLPAAAPGRVDGRGAPAFCQTGGGGNRCRGRANNTETSFCNRPLLPMEVVGRAQAGLRWWRGEEEQRSTEVVGLCGIEMERTIAENLPREERCPPSHFFFARPHSTARALTLHPSSDGLHRPPVVVVQQRRTTPCCLRSHTAAVLLAIQSILCPSPDSVAHPPTA